MLKEMTIQSVMDDIASFISENPGIISKIGVFGSLARGDFNEESDIDLLIKNHSGNVFNLDDYIQYCELCGEIEDMLEAEYKRKIDIVHIEDESLTNLFDENVKDEVVWL